MVDISQLPLNKQFSIRLAKPDTWIVTCYSASQANPNPHVLIGDTHALVIDATDTRLDLRGFLTRYVTDKPLMVASSHGHGDHTFANGQFNDCPIYMSQIAWDEIQFGRANGFGPAADGHVIGDYIPHIVRPGDVISLGGRDVEAVSFGGCHSPGSIGYLDRKHGIFFPGDEMESGQVLIQGDARGGDNSVEHYLENLLALKARRDEFDMICPAHNGTPMHAKVIDYFIENCERIMGGIAGEQDIASMTYLLNPHETRPPERVKMLRSDPKNRRSEWMGTSIIYSTDRVFRDRQ